MANASSARYAQTATSETCPQQRSVVADHAQRAGEAGAQQYRPQAVEHAAHPVQDEGEPGTHQDAVAQQRGQGDVAGDVGDDRDGERRQRRPHRKGDRREPGGARDELLDLRQPGRADHPDDEGQSPGRLDQQDQARRQRVRHQRPPQRADRVPHGEGHEHAPQVDEDDGKQEPQRRDHEDQRQRAANHRRGLREQERNRHHRHDQRRGDGARQDLGRRHEHRVLGGEAPSRGAKGDDDDHHQRAQHDEQHQAIAALRDPARSGGPVLATHLAQAVQHVGAALGALARERGPQRGAVQDEQLLAQARVALLQPIEQHLDRLGLGGDRFAQRDHLVGAPLHRLLGLRDRGEDLVDLALHRLGRALAPRPRPRLLPQVAVDAEALQVLAEHLRALGERPAPAPELVERPAQVDLDALERVPVRVALELLAGTGQEGPQLVRELRELLRDLLDGGIGLGARACLRQAHVRRLGGLDHLRDGDHLGLGFGRRRRLLPRRGRRQAPREHGEQGRRGAGTPATRPHRESAQRFRHRADGVAHGSSTSEREPRARATTGLRWTPRARYHRAAMDAARALPPGCDGRRARA
jgi:hypothetical protein